MSFIKEMPAKISDGIFQKILKFLTEIIKNSLDGFLKDSLEKYLKKCLEIFYMNSWNELINVYND